jgi:hypothetical protein
VLYAYNERLNKRKLQHCLKNHTFASLVGGQTQFFKKFERNISAGNVFYTNFATF